LDVDVLQIVLARAANRDVGDGHSGTFEELDRVLLRRLAMWVAWEA
jgi:hypothetical protein